MDTYTFEVELRGAVTPVIVVVGQNESMPIELTFDVFHGHDHLGTIYPDVDDNCMLTWKTDGDLAPEVVEDIGSKIEAVDM